MYDNIEENQDFVPDMILSDIHETLSNTYVPYKDFEGSYVINKKELKITKTNDVKRNISHKKRTWFM